MAKLTTIVGDATKPIRLGKVPIIIPHVCNDMGLWGAGFVLAISKAFGDMPLLAYKSWFKNEEHTCELDVLGHSLKVTDYFGLGEVQFVKLPDKKTVIANMIGQHKVGSDKTGRPPIRYAALAKAMNHVANLAIDAKAEIHCPKFGSDLAGGNWAAISDMILEIWVDIGINVTVYEFVPPKWTPDPDREESSQGRL